MYGGDVEPINQAFFLAFPPTCHAPQSRKETVEGDPSVDHTEYHSIFTMHPVSSRSPATRLVVRTGDAETSDVAAIGRFLLRPLVESVRHSSPKGVASVRSGSCLHGSPCSWLAVAIGVALS